MNNVETYITEFAKQNLVTGICSDDSIQVKNGEQTCAQHSERRSWAEYQCNILRTGVFKDCYEALSDDVASEAYENCLYDACGCSRGDDCKCLCSNLATFAKLCSNLKGINVNWRTQELCRESLIFILSYD